MRFEMPATKRHTRDVIASFPRFVAADADGLFLRSRFIIITPGESGYNPTGAMSIEQADRIAERWGAERAATEAEREAAQTGSMFGWDVPGADPANWIDEAWECRECGGTGIADCSLTFDAGDGEGEDRPCPSCTA